MANGDVIRVIDIGSGFDESETEQFLEGLDLVIVTLDANPDTNPDIVHDITEPFPDYLEGAFDIVFASHVLEHIDYLKVGLALRNLVSLLAPGGELHIIVPDMEWAARKILRGEENIALMGTIWGGQRHPHDYHRSGYSLLSLRLLVEKIGLIVRKATKGIFRINWIEDGEKKVAEVLQNMVIGLRYMPMMSEEEYDASLRESTDG